MGLRAKKSRYRSGRGLGSVGAAIVAGERNITGESSTGNPAGTRMLTSR
jgi:homoserine kinase